MAIKFEQTKNTKIIGKGILKEISEVGFTIEDEKEGTAEVLTFKNIEELLGKSVVISITNKEIDDE